MNGKTGQGIKRLTCAMLALLAASGWAVAAGPTAETWAAIAKYEFGQSRTNLAVVEEAIRTAPVKKYGPFEDQLLAVIKTPGATYDSKDFACRMLRIVGSEKCLPVMSGLMAYEQTSHIARYVIEGLPGAAVDDVLRANLTFAKGNSKIGIIGSLAVRGDKKAVNYLQPMLNDSDAGLAAAAIGALGRIGGDEAMKMLTNAKVADGLKAAVMEARLLCADSLLARGDTGKASAVYKEMLAEGNPKGIRAAAITGLARADKDSALPAVISLLKSKDVSCQRAAGKALMEIKGEKTAAALLAELPGLAPEAQVIAINALVVCGGKTAAADVAKMTASSDDAVKIAAIQALAVLGDVSNVELLSGLVKAGGEVGKTAVDSLAGLKGKGVSEAIMKSLATVDGGSKATLISSLAARQSPEVIPDLLKYAEDGDESVRVETLKSLGALAGDKDVPMLIGLMLKAKPARVQAAGEQAVQNVCARIKGESKRVEPLVAALKTASVEDRAVVLHCLGRVGGDKALEIVRESVKDKDEKVQEAAVRALVDWSDEGAIKDLVDLVKNAPKDNLKILAFRGYVRLVTLPVNVKKNAGKTAKTLAEAMKLAFRPDEKKLILGALGGIPDLAAMEAAKACIPDEALGTEAELACIKIAQSMKAGKGRDKAMEVVKTIAETSKNETCRKQAQAAIAKKK